MGKALRIVLAEDDELVLRTMRRYVESLGHSVIAEVVTGEDLVEQVIQCRPDMVILDIRLRGMDGLTAAETFSRSHRVPVIVISACEDKPTIERASMCPVQAHLAKPLRQADLAVAIPVVLKRFREMQTLYEDAQSARRRLADRAVVEQAKGVLMKRGNIDEAVAYHTLRTMARKSGQPLGQVARSLLLAEGAFTNLESSRQALASTTNSAAP